ncbi:Outer membrane lipid asymmetry maintenance protein MlaD-like protein [Candidatus Cyrtobacter comes]|uniref:Outer membrane lipid asymmetry maintenance protein MlaD-like protein n=1 Tax=Candidatus Cyrtobacter comes TaxID=675776 RepID=A0ABU5L988_9RICK|nr:MlaD family protein [Candidatus Cyrtobacter comes]MDZ5762681.1 Outer membrane lipid asymmetry maintenance protein MlaD-like protein [Candidatus Cyrtobacter comes]
MYDRRLETLVGAIVLFASIFFAVFIYLSKDSGSSSSMFFAKFSDVNGLKTGSNVLLNGVRVGQVSKCRLDNDFNAIVEMLIDSSIALPVDTLASISGLGIFSSKNVELIPGHEDDIIKPGGEISMTKPSFSIENLIGKVLFGATSSK